MMSAEVVNGGGGGGGGDLKKKNEEDMVQQQVQPIKKQKVVEKHKEDMVQQLPYLDEDIITQILLKIPAQSLFKTLRYVCKSWLNMISTHPDIHLNRLLPSKPPCLIIQNVDYKENNFITCFFTLSKEGKIIEQFDDLNPIFKNNLWIRACCNGQILASIYDSQTNVFYVVNPLTNHRVILPYPDSCTLCNPMDLVFIPSTGEYKVIVEVFLYRGKCIQILTLSASDCYGSSSSSNDRLQWRRIEAPKHILLGLVVAINGILYWPTSNIGNIVSFDANVEKFNETIYCHNDKRTPRGGGYWRLVEMGGLLSSWSILVEEYDDDAWRLYMRVVKDFHGGEWIDKYSIPIDTDFMKLINRHAPVLSIGDGEVLIFHSYEEKTMWVLNVKLNQWWEVGNKNLKEKSRFCFKGFHVNNKPGPLDSIVAIEE